MFSQSTRREESVDKERRDRKGSCRPGRGTGRSVRTPGVGYLAADVWSGAAGRSERVTRPCNGNGSRILPARTSVDQQRDQSPQRACSSTRRRGGRNHRYNHVWAPAAALPAPGKIGPAAQPAMPKSGDGPSTSHPLLRCASEGLLFCVRSLRLVESASARAGSATWKSVSCLPYSVCQCAAPPAWTKNSAAGRVHGPALLSATTSLRLSAIPMPPVPSDKNRGFSRVLAQTASAEGFKSLTRGPQIRYAAPLNYPPGRVRPATLPHAVLANVISILTMWRLPIPQGW